MKNINKLENTLFVFTHDGSLAVLEYMRNLTPQVLVGGMWVAFVIRSNSINEWSLWCVSLAMLFIFVYMVMANIINFLEKILAHMEKNIKGIPNYQKCDNPYSLKEELSHLFKIIKLIAKHKKILILELITNLILLLMPTVMVIVASISSAYQLHKLLFGI